MFYISSISLSVRPLFPVKRFCKYNWYFHYSFRLSILFMVFYLISSDQWKLKVTPKRFMGKLKPFP